MKYPLFSVDDHLIEPPNVWVDRLPSKYKDVGPRIVEENGQQVWVYEDKRNPYLGLNAVAGLPPEMKSFNPVRYDQMIPACYDPKARAEAFRQDGVIASVSFPDMAGFGGYRFANMRDRELANLCVSAYNDWQFEEWCAAAPDMFVPTILCQFWDPVVAAAEVRRCAALGARTVSFPDDPYQACRVSFNDPVFDPLWAALEETKIVVSLHGGGSGPLGLSDPGFHFLSMIIGAGTDIGSRLVCNLLISPVTRKFPGLKFIITESGVGFLPYLLERAELILRKNKAWSGMDDIPPREIFARSIYSCAVGERFGIEQRHYVGVDNILWESDFPHSETEWPDSQASVARLYAGIPQEDVDKITFGNAQRLLRFAGESAR